MASTSITLEVCTPDIGSVLAAQSGGARRIELCQGLTEGGLTPSGGLLQQVARMKGIETHVLIRPRGGDFLYTNEEVDVMLHDIHVVRAAGVAGIVTGALTSAGDVDGDIMQELIRAAGPMEVTFHRAFDVCRQPLDALHRIIQLGCRYLLTSGQAHTASQGQTLIRQLVSKADGAIAIMAGAGIRHDNVTSLVRATGVHYVHASASHKVSSRMTFHTTGVSMCSSAPADEYTISQTSPQEVRALLHALQQEETKRPY